MSSSKTLVYLLRRDLRIEDNPILHELATKKEHGFTHVLPVYVFSAQQIEISGFIPHESAEKSPYPEARSPVGAFWRCGPHRAKFLAESVWDVKRQLESIGSGLEIRAGMLGQTVKDLLTPSSKDENRLNINGVWMTAEEGVEEKREEGAVRRACEGAGVDFRLFADEKYFVDDRDLPFKDPKDLPDVFTSYRKMVEPLRDGPRDTLPKPDKSTLPPFPSSSQIPPQPSPFVIPDTCELIEGALLTPIKQSPVLSNPPPSPAGTQSAHPFRGGSQAAKSRLDHLITSGGMTSYKDTRNGLLGPEFSTKLSAWLSLGCITARQVHSALLDFEDARTPLGGSASGYGKGENEGTKAVRFELLWRDYMRLCTRKFGPKLFRLSGFREDSTFPWKAPSTDGDDTTKVTLKRVLEGTTGMGLIDASQRELYLTGYTSNRARQNVASFMAKHLGLDWRLGAEWYECMLVDYDVSSNWGNWQYVAGVGNDPRGEARVFNPVKQSWDYDPKAEYCKAWIPELRGYRSGRDSSKSATGTDEVENQKTAEEGKRMSLDIPECFQAWTIPEEKSAKLGLKGLEWVENPLKRIEFTVGRKQGGNHHNYHSHRGGRGGLRGGAGERSTSYGEGQNSRGVYGYGYGYDYGHGYASSGRGGFRGGRGYHITGYHNRGGGGRGWSNNGGRMARASPMEKDAAANASSGTVTQVENCAT